MQKNNFFLLLLLFSSGTIAQKIYTPDQVYGQLFHDVQMAKVFEDGKTFVDCIPKRNPKDIMYDYGMMKGPKMDLKKFVEENFELPHTPQLNYVSREKDIVMHIKNLWGTLKREADVVVIGEGWGGSHNSSLLPLPNEYIVPGGRFREIYYWDSYFTMLGLKESGETAIIENMVKNFAFLIDNYGHIPNGSRSYYLSRSQPPFFALMVELLAEIKGDSIYQQFLPQLEKEYAFWMLGETKLKPGESSARVVKLKDGSILNRYWDDNPVPRQESYREDIETAEKSGRNKTEIYRHLRAGAESGLDFSSRWFKDEKNISTIQTTDLIAVDLNCLLYKLELIIARGKMINQDEIISATFTTKASVRRTAIDKYCWNKTLKYYTDFNIKSKTQSSIVSLAGMYPFCVFQGTPDYLSLLAKQASVQIKTKLLQAGGVTTTANTTGQQWDAPNGWAPLQWMTVWGLDRCGQRELARDIAQRWIKINRDVFGRTGKMMEKYNVVDTKLEAGGGEYQGQDGFGWTNGVFLAMIKKYGLPKE
ncbi:MAG: alpha,alpha-trehalase TreF [Chitinophagaceae bacterium]